MCPTIDNNIRFWRNADDAGLAVRFEREVEAGIFARAGPRRRLMLCS
ncbi:hypothetical protein AAIG39_24130 [Phytobacter palmae]|uniref:Uncharacterized protein n=1 Tax=Phytobacter palmae TaxID=1855371 RepID=A0ABU9VBS6_9ENTR